MRTLCVLSRCRVSYSCCCIQGWASTTLPPLDGPPPSTGMQPLLDVLLQHVPPPRASPEEAFAMCVAMIERDPFVGRIATGAQPAGY